MNTDNVTTEDWIVAGLALLLAIALLFFPWFDISAGPFSVTFTATGSPDGWLGVLALIATVLVLADIAVERLSPDTEIPSIRGSRTETRFILAAVAAGFVALKFLFHIHFSLFGWGFYVTVILTAALVYFTLQQRGAAASLATGTSRPGGAAAAAPRDERPAETGGPAEPGEAAATGGATETGGAGEAGGSPGPGGSVPPPGS